MTLLTHWILPLVGSAALAGGVFLPAQDTQLDAKQLKEMITNLGYVPKDLAEGKFEFVVSREGLDIPLAAEVSASKNYVWLTAYFGQIPTDFGDRPLKMLRANFEVQPSQFYITKSDKLMMGIALDNRNIHPAILRRNVDKVAKDVASTQALWTFDGVDQSGPQTQAR